MKNKSEKVKTSGGVTVKKVLLAIGIAIIFSLFVGFGIDTFYNGPYSNGGMCDYSKQMPTTKDACLKSGFNWTADQYGPKWAVPEGYEVCKNVNGTYVAAKENETLSSGFCLNSDFCESKMKPYARNVFIVTMVLGLAAVIVSVILSLASVSAGLMAGGILVLIYGIIQYWRYSTDILRFLILGAALAILIWLGYKKLNK